MFFLADVMMVRNQSIEQSIKPLSFVFHCEGEGFVKFQAPF